MATLVAADATYNAVNAQVQNAQPGDTVQIPQGTATWNQGLVINKNIKIIGAGEGKTVITASGFTAPAPVFFANLTTERTGVNGDYSFQLGYMSIRGGVSYGQDNGFITVQGKTTLSTSPAPHQLGCVSYCRVNNIDALNIAGDVLVFQSALGVVDHCVFKKTDAAFSHPVQVFCLGWTPNPGSPGALSPPGLLANAFGSWADDAYWGTDRFVVFEDCYFGGLYNNVCDNLKGARVVFRHCTIDNNLGIASHGMEGNNTPGVRAQEVYNNKFNMPTGGNAQTRSGNILLFNNLWSNCSGDWPIKIYRDAITEANWGMASGDNRYDTNSGSAWTGPNIVNGIFGSFATGTANGDNNRGPIFDSNSQAAPVLSQIKASLAAQDGFAYAINNIVDPFTGTNAQIGPGWQYHGGMISSITGNEIGMTVYNQGLSEGEEQGSARWHVGDNYTILQLSNMYGQIGSGRCKPLTGGGAKTWVYPATSGTFAVDPQGATAHKEPSYAWNNYNASFTNPVLGQINLKPGDGETTILEGRDVFNKGELSPLTTQQVGYNPPSNYPTTTTATTESYTRAASANAQIVTVPDGAPITYVPLSYPHPLIGGAATPTITSASTVTFTAGTGGTFTVTTSNFSNPPTFAITGSLPTNISFNNSTGVFSGTASGATGGNYALTITATNSVPTPHEVATQSFILKILASNTPPTISLSSPLAGATFTAPATITLQAAASDTDGFISSIQYYYGGTNLIATVDATLSSPPYTAFFTNVSAGTYSLTAKATDNQGSATTSSAVSVTVNAAATLQPPKISVRA